HDTITGQFKIQAVAIDNQGKTDTSELKTIEILGYRVADNPTNTVNGVIYRYYKGVFDAVPDFGALTLDDGGVINQISLAATGKLGDKFALQFSAFINIPQKGEYTFFTSSDDGSVLYIGDQMIVDNDGLHDTKEDSGRVLLNVGLHEINVGYFEKDGGENLLIEYRGPGIPKSTVPKEALFYQAKQAEMPLLTLAFDGLADSVFVGENIPLLAQFTDTANQVVRIEYYVNKKLSATTSFTGTSYSYKANKADEFSFFAKIYDLYGNSSTSNTLATTVYPYVNGIIEHVTMGASVYPNPIQQGYLNIVVPAAYENQKTELSITNLLGQVVYRQLFISTSASKNKYQSPPLGPRAFTCLS
ncbi:MAG: hypothetical protein HC896_14045, partial [Bacteroidales bacterium]|nr:hypothetical protein [Bacteroidales bacterium]